MAPYQTPVGEGGFDDSLIEPADSCRVGAPQLTHGISVKEETSFGFVDFVDNVRGSAKFVVKENSKIFDCVREFDGGIIKGEGGK